MAQHRLGTGTWKTLDFEVLLNPLKAEFDLPPRFVNVSNGNGCLGFNVGDKRVVFPGFLIDNASESQPIGIFLLAWRARLV